MQLPDSTPPKPISDQFKRDVRELQATFDALRPALHVERGAHQLTDHRPIDPRTMPSKEQVQHYLGHILTGLLTLHDSDDPNPETAREVLSFRRDTTVAIAALKMTEYQFREGTQPRDHIDRLDRQLIDLYRDLEPMAKSHTAAAAASKDRSGPRSIG